MKLEESNYYKEYCKNTYIIRNMKGTKMDERLKIIKEIWDKYRDCPFCYKKIRYRNKVHLNLHIRRNDKIIEDTSES